MTDLLHALPDFDVGAFSHLLPSLDKHRVTLSDLLTLDAIDVAKRAQVPPGEVRRLTNVALQQLHRQLGVDRADSARENAAPRKATTSISIPQDWETISTLDATLDQTLGGGIPTRYLTEIVGESGAGKTQFLLSLLLAVQLPVERGGLASSAVYISTEAALSTSRLSQMLRTNQRFSSLPADQTPSLNRILTLQTPDLESQDHILRYQLPVAIRRHGIRLIIIDSIAANYRVEFDRKSGSSDLDGSESAQDRKAGGEAMAARRAQLIQLGALLRDLAREHNLAVVLANQVADRFFLAYAPPANAPHARRVDLVASQRTSPPPSRTPSSNTAPSRTPSASSSTAPPPAVAHPPQRTHHDPMTLDHQQRFFTGWGDIALPPSQLKTPSLGLVWANQLACRIALTRDPGSGSGDRTHAASTRKQRWMRVVFSAWSPPTTGRGIGFEICAAGVRAVSPDAEPRAERADQDSTKRIKLDAIDPDGGGTACVSSAQ